MNKKNLFSKKEANLDTTNGQFVALCPDIPFYGIKDTICRIEVSKDLEGRELSYHKVLYNHDGTINPKKVNIPRNKGKNLDLLLGDYYGDLKKYLEVNSNQYFNCKNNSLKKKVDKKKTQILIVILAIVSLALFPVMGYTTGIASTISAILTASSLLGLYMQVNSYAKIIAEEKNKKYIDNYEEKHEKLVQFIGEQEKKKLKNSKNGKVTNFTPIATANKDLNAEKCKNKIKILVKEEEIQEVA